MHLRVIQNRLRVGLIAMVFASPTFAEETELVPCLDCHQASTTLGEVPLIEGQHAAYLTAQLQRFREQHRESFPMAAMAGGLSDESLARKVAEISARPWADWPRDSKTENAERLQRGAAVAERFACADCHGPAFMGGDVIPRLAGQRPGYIEQQLKAIAAGRRYHPPTAIGAKLDSLDEADQWPVALWVSRVP